MCEAKCEACGDVSVKAYSYVKNNIGNVCKSCAMKAVQKEKGNGNNHKRLFRIWSNMKTRCYRDRTKLLQRSR